MLVAAGISRRVEGTAVTMPMVYTALGLLLGSQFLNVVGTEISGIVMRVIAELTLVLVLASDASRINLRMLVRDHSLPLRLLVIGLPLTMLAGTAAGYLVFGGIGVWTAAVLAIVLTPTDASLGQSVIASDRVPVRIRQTLNIESGLNDGIAMPFLLLAVSFAAASEIPSLGSGAFVVGAFRAIGLGAIVGVFVGGLGALYTEYGERSGWMSDEFQRISGLVLAVMAFVLAELVGGNGFIAAFGMGFVSGAVHRHRRSNPRLEYLETEVQLLTLVTFLFFGAVLLPTALSGVNAKIVLYAVLSLTVVRMVPVAVSLIGARVRPATTLFLGWFGPRGIASIIYVFVVAETEILLGRNLIYSAAMVTVLISIFAHGLTAGPIAKRYGKLMARLGDDRPDAPEMKPVPEMPLNAPSSPMT